MDRGFGDWPTRHALRNADHTAYVDAVSGATTTWRALEERTNRLADALSRKGVRRGDRVATLTLNSPQMMEIFFAVAKLGAITVPVNFRLSAREVAYVLNDSGAIALFASTSLCDLADAALEEVASVRIRVAVPTAAERAESGEGEYGDLVAGGDPERVERPVDDTDVCVIMYTSGTTGRPKGAMLTHRNFQYNAMNGFARRRLQPQRHHDLLGTAVPHRRPRRAYPAIRVRRRVGGDHRSVRPVGLARPRREVSRHQGIPGAGDVGGCRAGDPGRRA